MDFSVATIVLWAVPVVFAITLHEAAHGYVARIFGDQTAYMLGRVTLNPVRHIDPIGTIAVPGVLIAVSLLTKAPLFIFGWAKPVPVNFGNLRHPKRDMLWVAAAAPAANFAMAVAWAFVAKLSTSNGIDLMASIGIITNVVLMVLNLFPILPLDGGRIAVSLLPHRLAMSYARLEPYGFMLVILLLVTGALNVLMMPFVNFFLSFFSSLAGG